MYPVGLGANRVRTVIDQIFIKEYDLQRLPSVETITSDADLELQCSNKFATSGARPLSKHDKNALTPLDSICTVAAVLNRNEGDLAEIVLRRADDGTGLVNA